MSKLVEAHEQIEAVEEMIAATVAMGEDAPALHEALETLRTLPSEDAVSAWNRNVEIMREGDLEDAAIAALELETLSAESDGRLPEVEPGLAAKFEAALNLMEAKERL